jgi:hypothetical protein
LSVMAARKQQLINLLPQEEFAGSTVGRVLVWAMSTFRYIVIGTEMVVMVAFLSRFWLDARNIDLNDLIKQKVGVISAYAEFEKDFRDTQKRLKIFGGLANEERTPSYYLDSITSYLPNDIRLVNFVGSETAYQLRAVSFSEASIAQYIVNLKESGDFEKVSISSLDVSQQNDGLYTFNLKLSPKGGAN